jgi:hypothetical protein
MGKTRQFFFTPSTTQLYNADECYVAMAKLWKAWPRLMPVWYVRVEMHRA